MARRNRVDPFGDLHAVPDRGMFTGNRGCLVDNGGEIARHHRGNLWVTCVTRYKDWRSPLAEPGRWTPVFFLDDAVALAAGHRPCGLCRRDDYLSYQATVRPGDRIPAAELNRLLARERLRRGRGVDRRGDRKTWRGDLAELPHGTVILERGDAYLLADGVLYAFGFDQWRRSAVKPDETVDVLTPPTSVAALRNGFLPSLHPSAKSPTVS